MGGRLHLVRHGQTISNTMGRLDTRPPGSPLTDLGARQAIRFGLERPDASVAALYCSTAVRAQQTAELIGSAWGMTPTTLADIHEVQVGDLEDRRDRASVHRFRELIKDWYGGDTAQRVGNSESYDDLVARYVPVIESVAAQHLGDDADADVYVVSHGAAIRLMAAHLAGVDGQFALDNGLANTESIELSYSGSTWECLLWAGRTPVAGAASSGVDPMG